MAISNTTNFYFNDLWSFNLKNKIKNNDKIIEINSNPYFFENIFSKENYPRDKKSIYPKERAGHSIICDDIRNIIIIFGGKSETERFNDINVYYLGKIFYIFS